MRVLISLLLLAATTLAQPVDPNTTARAGVHDLGLKFGSALLSNPAQLAQEKPYRFSLELLSLSASGWNNSFSTGFWNREIAGDHYLDAAAEQRILDRIPDQGLRLDGAVSVPVFGLTYNNVAGRVSLESAGSARLPRDLARLGFEGNLLNQPYTVGSLRGEGLLYMNYALGFGHTFEQEYVKRFSAGAGFHFYQGLELGKVAQVSGELVLSDSIIDGGASLQGVTSHTGDGVGFDLGAVAELNDRWQVGLALREIGVRMSWQVDENSFISFYADSVRIAIDSLDDEDYLDRALQTTDTTYKGGAIETKLPVILQANARYAAAPTLALLGEFGFASKGTPTQTAAVNVGGAAAWQARPWLLLQGGVSVGSPYGIRSGAGIGLRFNYYEFDLAGSWLGGLFNGAKGVDFGIVHRLKF
ncbi:hypothetical protein HZB60_01260 [candidate division KSB1 bacterium]|nr:hypothetical protein [candidate division KSB1 bacterium]